MGDDSIFEFDFNAEVANNLGCLIMPVVQGHERKNYQIIDAVNRLRHALVESDCDLFASIINGVEASQVEELRKRYSHQPDSTFPVCVVPSEPSLNMLSVGNISRQLDASILSGDQQTLNRAVKHFKIAAMQVPDFLEHLEEGDLIITPSDRADIILACAENPGNRA